MVFKTFLGRRQVSATQQVGEDQPIEELVKKIQQGDLKLRNQFIADYQPFIVKITSQFSKRYIDPAKDDEFSIALTAFNEAINQYSEASGNSFLGFSKTVMIRRLIDYVRKEEKHKNLIPYSSFDMEDEEEYLMNPIEIIQSVKKYKASQENESRKAEICELNAELMTYDITFQDLVNVSPKHRDSREELKQIAVELAKRDDVMKKMKEKKLLPIKDVLEWAKVSRKTLERNRKYIIAVSLIYAGNYPYLKEYLYKDRKE